MQGAAAPAAAPHLAPMHAPLLEALRAATPHADPLAAITKVRTMPGEPRARLPVPPSPLAARAITAAAPESVL